MAILARPINDRNAHLRDYSPKVTQCLPTAGPLPPLAQWWAHLVARRPKLSRRSPFALRASVDSLRRYESEGWAHFEFTRINIEPIILRKKIEDLREAGGDLDEDARAIGGWTEIVQLEAIRTGADGQSILEGARR